MTTRTWSEAKGAALAALREAYHQEVERLAEEFRPRLESGELHGFAAADDDAAAQRLEDAIRAHFGLAVTEEPGPHDGVTWLRGDDATAHAILAVSSFTDELDADGWWHAADHATAAAARDVLAAARRLGFYSPGVDEQPHPGHLDDGQPHGCTAA